MAMGKGSFHTRVESQQILPGMFTLRTAITIGFKNLLLMVNLSPNGVNMAMMMENFTSLKE